MAVWAGVSLVGEAARAQQLQQPLQVSPGLTPMLRYFALDVVSGRIVAFSPTHDRKLESQSTGKDRRERLSITLGGAATSVSYELVVGEVQVGYEIVDGAEVTASRRDKGAADGAFVEFHQPRTGAVSLRIGEGEREAVYEAANLWRLLAAEPELCRRRLAPLLELLKPDWRLSQTALDAEQSLYESAKLLTSAPLADWRRWVDELGDEKYSKRQAADRQLRGLGRGGALFLMSIDSRGLDAEQQSRIRTIFQDLSGGQRADTPERVAFFLVREPYAWLRLLESDDLAQRRLALGYLERLAGPKLAFDAAGEKAQRDEQLAALRRHLESTAAQRESPRR